MALLEVQNIIKYYPGKKIIDNISFKQEALQKIAITGESGSGKSTLLKIISGHVQADSGITIFNGVKVIGPEDQLYPGHKEIAYLSQHYELLNNYYIKDLIWYQLKIEETTAAKLFEICRISNLLERRTNQISGGEKQRIALCMLLVKSPKLLILDEPFSNLDLIHTDTLKHVLEDVTGNLRITCLLTSHDPNDTLSWADEIIVMKEGKIIQKGKPQNIYHNPVNEYVAGIFGKYNLLEPEKAALFGINTNENVMIRPEEFYLPVALENGVKGIVKKISFLGSFYETEVLIDDLSLIVRTGNNLHNTGDKIFISMK